MAGKAKVTGTLMCMAGAMLFTFYKGVEIKTSLHNFNLLKHGHAQYSQHRHYMILGSILAFLSSLSWSLGLILQAKMSHGYPCPYSSTALISIMGAIQATLFALCTVRTSWTQWKLGFDIRLLSVSFSGIVASGIMSVLLMWCVRIRGPLFVSVFSPLTLILVQIAGLLFLDEKLHLGSILGSLLIVCGLYSVIFGKTKDMKKISEFMPESTSHKFEQQTEVQETNGRKKNSSLSTSASQIISNNIDIEEDEDDEEMGISIARENLD